mgnify:CR=1 FL=1
MNNLRPMAGIALAFLGIVGLASPALATLQTIEQAYELTRDQVQLPSDAASPLRVRPCRKCSMVVLKVTSDTRWFTAPGSRAVPRQELLAAFRQASLEPATLIYVYYEPQTKQVKRVVLDRRAPAARP